MSFRHGNKDSTEAHHEVTYPTYPNVKIMAISWNMGNAKPDGLNRVIPFKGGDNDIITLGLQESTWSGLSDDDSGCVQYLLNDINEILTDEFRMIAHNKRAQMQQLVYARYTITERITNVDSKSENTGFFHVFPNKGGLRVSMNIDGTKIAFISCHLAAHEGVDKCATRNSSVEEILDGVLTGNHLLDIHHTFFMGDMNYRCTFNKKTPLDLTAVDKEKSRKKSSKKDAKVAGMADEDEDQEGSSPVLRSELDSDAEDDVVEDKDRAGEMNELYQMITEERWEDMLRLDELNREMAANRALVGYVALQPRFPPTFKRIRQKSIWKREDSHSPLESALSASTTPQQKVFDLQMGGGDSNEAINTESFYNKKRLPSFTDRILTCSMPAFKDSLTNLSFTSGEEAVSSDHKPVIAEFNLVTSGGLRGIMAYSTSFITSTYPRYTTSTTYRVKNLQGFDLAEMDSALFGGGSDPYVVLTADPRQILIGKKLRTPAITHELNPVWKETIEFRLATNDVVGLSKCAHLFLSVWDYDVTNDDDLIGVLTIPLADLFEHFSKTSGADFPFRGSLVRNGLYHGVLQGTIELGGSRREAEHEDHPHHMRWRVGRTQTLFDVLSSRHLGDPRPGTGGCGCVLS